MADLEHNLQVSCVNWFRMQHRQYAIQLVAVPNGGKCSKAVAKKLKAEGVTRGVSDLILFVPNKAYHALCIEMKVDTPTGEFKKRDGVEKVRKGIQSDEQKDWQKAIETQGYKYVVCRSIEGFMNEVNNYLKLNQ